MRISCLCTRRLRTAGGSLNPLRFIIWMSTFAMKVSNASGHDVSRAISAVERHSSPIRWTIRLILE
ncbi:hypothetical protein [Bifidobacterium longum]|uniref:hypothetical protein n=1 Tax=Bifidobacterium longum TaxID=216816 RepID=UPI001F600C07|nr:hypothetical protein [Bifidobacterium longum]